MDKFIKRDVWDKVVNDLQKEEITIILGPRQVGKTTLILKLINYLKDHGVKKEQIYYYNLDDVELRGRIKKDFYFLKKDIEQTFGKTLENIKDKLFLFIDEGQKVPAIFELVKIFFDQKYRLKIIISGSSSITIKDKSAETLAGRVSYFYLSPLIFSELAEKNLSIYNNLEKITNSDFLREKTAEGYRNIKEYQYLLDKMLLFGAFPKVVNLNPSDAVNSLNNFIATYLDKDIKDIGSRVDIENFHLSFKNLIDYLANLINFSKLSSDLGIKRDSIYHYFELMEKTLVVQTVPPFIFPNLKHIFKSKKFFFFDNGVATRLKGYLNLDELKRSQFTGSLFENFIFQNLYCRSLNDIKKPSFYYFRDYQNHEIDFIYQRGDVIVPIEATYSHKIEKAKLRNFHHFFRLYPKASYGIIFYLGEVQKISIGEKSIFTLPFFLV